MASGLRRRLLTVVGEPRRRFWQLLHSGSLVMAHRLSFSHSIWDLPRPGIEPVSPAWHPDHQRSPEAGFEEGFYHLSRASETWLVGPDEVDVGS